MTHLPCPRFAANNCLTRELQKKASEPATAPAGAELEPQVLAVAVAVPQEQYLEGVRAVAAASGAVQDLEIPSFSLGKVQDSR